jgi:hypothetical protein
MILWNFVQYGLWSGHTLAQISQTVQTTFVETWKSGIVLWSAVQIANQSYVPALYQTVTLDCVAFFWDMYMTYQLVREKRQRENEEKKRSKAA